MNLQTKLFRPSIFAMTGLISCATLLVPIPAFAVWDYSLAAKLAMYDGLEESCQHLVPALFDEVKGQLIYLDPDEKLQASQARQSAEYFQVLQEMRRSAFSPGLPDGRENIKECTAALSRYQVPPN